MIQPTNGRVVWYWPEKHEGFTVLDRTQPCAATVAFVHTDRRVNLTVHDHAGNTHAMKDVKLVHPEDGEMSRTKGGFCEWMPFQKGQAAAADAKSIGV